MNTVTKKCPMCAEQIPLESATCEYCGARFEVTTRDDKIESKFIGEAVPSAAQAPAAPPVQPEEQPLQAAPPLPKKNAWIGWVIGGVVVLGLLAVVGFLVFQNGLRTPGLLASTTPTRIPTRTRTPTPKVDTVGTVNASNATAMAQLAFDELDTGQQWPNGLWDTFDSNINTWPLTVEPVECFTGNVNITDNRLIWQATGYRDCFWKSEPFYSSVSDFVLSVNVERKSNGIAGGVTFRSQSSDDFYAFFINQYDSYTILHWLNGEWIELAYEYSPAIHHNGLNQLTVSVQGEHMLFFINDQYVAERYEDNILGKVGIFIVQDANTEASIEFDDFKLLTP